MEGRIVRLIRVNRILILWARMSLWLEPNFLLDFAPIIDTIYKASLCSIVLVCTPCNPPMTAHKGHFSW